MWKRTYSFEAYPVGACVWIVRWWARKYRVLACTVKGFTICDNGRDFQVIYDLRAIDGKRRSQYLQFPTAMPDELFTDEYAAQKYADKREAQERVSLA